MFCGVQNNHVILNSGEDKSVDIINILSTIISDENAGCQAMHIN